MAKVDANLATDVEQVITLIQDEKNPKTIERTLQNFQMTIVNSKNAEDVSKRAAQKKFKKLLEKLANKSDLPVHFSQSLKTILSTNLADSTSILEEVGQAFSQITTELALSGEEGHVESKGKKKDLNNFTAADFSWTGRSILSGIKPILKSLANQYPENSDVKGLQHKCTQLEKNSNLDVFQVVELMEGTSNLVTVLSSAQANRDTSFLAQINKDLLQIHSAMNQLESTQNEFSQNQGKSLQELENSLKHFEKLSEDATNLPQLKKSFAENIGAMKGNIGTLVQQHQEYKQEQEARFSKVKQQLKTSLKEQDKLRISLEVSEQASLLDELTQVGNRKAYHNATVETDEQYQDEFNSVVSSIIILDIDRFKGINDQYGHELGDRVLVRIANILKKRTETLRKKVNCQLSRYGGEEFVIVMPATPTKKAALIAELIRQEIGSYEFEDDDGEPIIITCTCGVAEYSPLYNKADEVFKLADKCLYLGKSSGRDQVRYFHRGEAVLYTIAPQKP